MKEKIYDARTGMEYALVDDYYLPALKLPRTRPIGRWGMLHKAYLKLRKPAYYQSLLLSGKLDTVLANVEEQAVERYEVLIEQLSQWEGVSEKLKEENQEEQNTQDQETDVEGDEEKAEIPEESTLDINYTSVDGLRMEKGSRISVVIKNTESDYWKAAKKGMEQAVFDLNEYLGYKGDDAITCTIEGPKDENGVDEQVNILDMVLTENPVVVCLSAADMSSCEAQLEAAQEDGIPVVMLDSGVKSDDDLVYAYCGTDNKAAGEEAAKQLCEAIKDAGEVAVMSHTQLSQSSKDRVEGFQEEITKNHPNVSVVSVDYQPSKDDDPTEEESIEAVLEKYPDLKGYYATNQATSEAVLSVLDKHTDRSVQMIGVDMGDTQKKAIEDGKEVGSVCQNPYGMGYATIVAGARASLGLESDKKIDSGFQWIDKNTIGLEEYARYLY